MKWRSHLQFSRLNKTKTQEKDSEHQETQTGSSVKHGDENTNDKKPNQSNDKTKAIKTLHFRKAEAGFDVYVRDFCCCQYTMKMNRIIMMIIEVFIFFSVYFTNLASRI